ncbi:MAG TPA: chemotaxis protein CheW [Bryobacteraceae bacterium]|jgi:purine-binding chemotaxis protein CheW|nr:chemotaxis protein CheW [Bryobacteraceae bacterium]
MMPPTNRKQSAIDWKQVRERLRAGEHALAEALSESHVRVEAAYRKRAAQLANGQSRNEPRTAGVPALVFSLGPEHYAIELRELAEAIPLGRCTPVPGAAAAFLGVINLRGELRPVVDLGRMVLNIENETSRSGFVLMLRRPGREIGLKVDRLEGLCEVQRDQIRASGQGKYTRSIAGETLLMLDIERVLADVFP